MVLGFVIISYVAPIEDTTFRHHTDTFLHSVYVIFLAVRPSTVGNTDIVKPDIFLGVLGLCLGSNPRSSTFCVSL